MSNAKKTAVKKLNIKIILIQWIGIFFLINGFLRLYYSVYAEEINYLLNSKENNSKTLRILHDFLDYQIFAAFAAYFLGVTLIALINWKNKNHFWNSIIVALLTFVIFPSGLFFRGVICNFFNSFGGKIINNATYSFLIGGITLSLIGGFLIWKSSKIK